MNERITSTIKRRWAVIGAHIMKQLVIKCGALNMSFSYELSEIMPCLPLPRFTLPACCYYTREIEADIFEHWPYPYMNPTTHDCVLRHGYIHASVSGTNSGLLLRE